MIGQLRGIVELALAGEWSEIRRMVGVSWRSESTTIGLRRELLSPFTAQRASIPITVRPLRDDDFPILFGRQSESSSGEALRQQSVRNRMARANLATCYVAANEADEPCYVQWLIGPGENEKIRALFGDQFPVLQPGEMLLEGAFTSAAWRGKGIMGAAMAEIAAKGLDEGARWVITFVDAGNIPSLKGCNRSGFEPYLGRIDQWRRFRHSSRFAPLAPPTGEHEMERPRPLSSLPFARS